MAALASVVGMKEKRFCDCIDQNIQNKILKLAFFFNASKKMANSQTCLCSFTSTTEAQQGSQHFFAREENTQSTINALD